MPLASKCPTRLPFLAQRVVAIRSVPRRLRAHLHALCSVRGTSFHVAAAATRRRAQLGQRLWSQHSLRRAAQCDQRVPRVSARRGKGGGGPCGGEPRLHQGAGQITPATPRLSWGHSRRTGRAQYGPRGQRRLRRGRRRRSSASRERHEEMTRGQSPRPWAVADPPNEAAHSTTGPARRRSPGPLPPRSPCAGRSPGPQPPRPTPPTAPGIRAAPRPPPQPRQPRSGRHAAAPLDRGATPSPRLRLRSRRGQHRLRSAAGPRGLPNARRSV